MKRNPLETVLGAVVLLVAVMFLVFASSVTDLKAVTGYAVTATFQKVGGLERGSDVRISGIRVGTVSDQVLDHTNFQARVTMSIAPDITLPTDTQASIVSDGLLGAKYVNLTPGQSADRIAPGGTLARTKDYQSLEDLVGQIIFAATSSSSDESAPK